MKVVFGQSRCEFREKDDGVEYKEKLITNYVLKVETNTKLSLDFRPFLSHRALCKRYPQLTVCQSQRENESGDSDITA